MTQATYVSRTWKLGNNKNSRFLVCKPYLWVQYSRSTAWDVWHNNLRATPQWSVWGSSNLELNRMASTKVKVTSCTCTSGSRHRRSTRWISLKVIYVTLAILLWPIYEVSHKPPAVSEPQRKKRGFLVSPGYSSSTWPHWPTGSAGVRPGCSGICGKFR